ncbi:hypothetical protein PQQ96_05905 [Paraburkholderia sediminicola]|uniref:hypothetical protein n=1 Tax=Paraburkholderia sediminicola TaxID=458836 RepID=UPI0038B9D9AC
MNAFEISKDEYDRISGHLSRLATEFDRPNPAAQRVRDAALHYANKYFTTPGDVTRPDISTIREFLTRHGRNPDANPWAEQSRPASDDWVRIGERLPELSATATEISVKVRHLVDDKVVESPARFVSEQSSLNPVDEPCFVLLGRQKDLLNPQDEGRIVSAHVQPTHWRLHEA